MASTEEEYVTQNCAWCRGTGEYGFENSPCPACDGKGIVNVPAPPEKCGNCNGKGFDPGNKLERCPVCQGTGWEDSKKII